MHGMIKEVFCTLNKDNNKWNVIDKATNELIEEVDDVLLFNPVYKRFNNIKGWHGILSEEINPDVIRLMARTLDKIVFIPKKYYPRYEYWQEHPIRSGRYLRLKDGEMFYRVGTLSKYSLEEYCKPWENSMDPGENEHV